MLEARHERKGGGPVSRTPQPLWLWWLLVGAASLLSLALADRGIAATEPDLLGAQHGTRQYAVPILGTTLSRSWKVTGVVVYVQIEFEQREDRDGMRIQFRRVPGRFSLPTKRAVIQATSRAAHAAGLEGNSWTIILTFLQPGVTLYGDSLSAMVGLSAVALAKGDPLYLDRVITGTITDAGRIGMVGGVPYKIRAAHANELHRVMIPEELPATDGDWNTPFLMQVSPVGTIHKAYFALTDRPM